MTKKYILIQNDGEIEPNSFELIGASTKRDESGKIGFFGSGLKYSIAYMMRNGIDFRIFSGENELRFTTVPETLKEKQFDRICINGKPTSYTVTMGPTWTEDWFVLREIYCNALDENNCQLVRETENVNPASGKTRIYIEATDSLNEIIRSWDAYFSIEREPLFVSDNIYTSFLSSKVRRQPVSVYRKTKGVLFRKGIRVYRSDKLMYDYGIEEVNINEDRTASDVGAIAHIFCDIVGSLDSFDYVSNVLRSGTTENPCREYGELKFYSPDGGFSQSWVDFSNKFLLVVEEKSGKYADEMAKSRKEVLYIPIGFARSLKAQWPEVVILGMGRSIGDTTMTDIDTTPKMDFLLKEVTKSLSDMGYDVSYDVKVAQFDDEHILGQADITSKTIYLSDRVFDMGRREIAMTLIEEAEHIYSGKGDETRAFQTHLISQWLKSMENQNGLFL